MPEVVSWALANGPSVGGAAVCVAFAFALTVSLFSDRVNRRFVKLLRAMRSGK